MTNKQKRNIQFMIDARGVHYIINHAYDTKDKKFQKLRNQCLEAEAALLHYIYEPMIKKNH